MFHLVIYTCVSPWIFSGNILCKSEDVGISRKMNHEFRITLIHPGYMLKYVYVCMYVCIYIHIYIYVSSQTIPPTTPPKINK